LWVAPRSGSFRQRAPPARRALPRAPPEMPPDALALALAASIYPPAVAAVIALGRGPQLRLRLLTFTSAAFFVTYAAGVLMLFVLQELGATSHSSISASAGVEIAIGAALLALGAHLYRGRARGENVAPESSGTSKIDRYLASSRLAAVLGVTLYLLPSPFYIAAVKSIADAQLARGSELLALLAVVASMLWIIELPMLMLVLAHDRAERALDGANRWFAANGRSVAIAACAAAGAYLIAHGVARLPG